jgi:hypothetical protein
MPRSESLLPMQLASRKELIRILDFDGAAGLDFGNLAASLGAIPQDACWCLVIGSVFANGRPHNTMRIFAKTIVKQAGRQIWCCARKISSRSRALTRCEQPNDF